MDPLQSDEFRTVAQTPSREMAPSSRRGYPYTMAVLVLLVLVLGGVLMWGIRDMSGAAWAMAAWLLLLGVLVARLVADFVVRRRQIS